MKGRSVMKRTLMMTLCIALCATLAIGGTMAYLQDTDSDVNVMTLGSVKIDQIELERGENGVLQAFTTGKALYPAVMNDVSAWQPALDENDPHALHFAAADQKGLIEGIPEGAWSGMWNDEQIQNVQDKLVFVKNTGKSNAYFRTIIAFESEPADYNYQSADGNSLIHVNWNSNDRFDYDQNTDGQQTWENKSRVENVEINGQLYDIWTITYTDELAPGEVARPSLLQIGMDRYAGNEHVEMFGDTYDVLVVTQAVQTAGFASADAALDAAFGPITATNHPWVNGVTNAPVMVSTAAELQAALDAATGDANIVMVADITGDVTVSQKEGVNITLNGQNNEYTGTIYIHGQARSTGAETLTIKNIKFASDDTIDFISCNSTDSEKRYAHNVTIEGCDFTGADGKDVVGARFRQCYNITMKDCKAQNMHSLMWATGCSMLTFDNVTIADSKSGISIGTSNAVIKNSDITVVEHGIRADGGVYTLTVENTKIKAAQPVIVRRMTADGYTLNLSGNTLTATSTDGYQVILTTGSDDATYAAPTSAYTLTGADENLKIYK